MLCLPKHYNLSFDHHTSVKNSKIVFKSLQKMYLLTLVKEIKI